MKDDFTIREFEPGDASLVSHLHMIYYMKHYNFKGIFEHYVMKGISEFLKNPNKSQLWIAVKENKIVGSIAIVNISDETAQLRWFIVDNEMQGRGLGNKLMDKAMDFCKENCYKKIFLWTFDSLDAARHLYKKHGFIPIETQENNEWSSNIILEEKWELNL